ncbi:MAG: triose-phosphate isomerase [Cyanobacteriota bacterium]|nr:triose-phosphate isomerase [Cyanobacteriota bacterium]
MRPTVIAGNWKMYKTQAQAQEFLANLTPHLPNRDPLRPRQVILCVPFTDLGVVGNWVVSRDVGLGAQNIHWEDQGAFTGEISPPMLVELGVSYVVVGHSERRQHFGETDATVNQRLLAAQRHGLTPILCVGETKQLRQQGQTESWILQQLQQGLVGVDQQRLIIAYEPIWAIGTGDTCEASEANRVIGLIRQQLDNPHLVIQYGGSVKGNNIDEIMAQPQIDGVLVGGASLDAEEFGRIINFRALTVA